MPEIEAAKNKIMPPASFAFKRTQFLQELQMCVWKLHIPEGHDQHL